MSQVSHGSGSGLTCPRTLKPSTAGHLQPSSCPPPPGDTRTAPDVYKTLRGTGLAGGDLGILRRRTIRRDQSDSQHSRRPGGGGREGGETPHGDVRRIRGLLYLETSQDHDPRGTEATRMWQLSELSDGGARLQGRVGLPPPGSGLNLRAGGALGRTRAPTGACASTFSSLPHPVSRGFYIFSRR